MGGLFQQMQAPTSDPKQRQAETTHLTVPEEIKFQAWAKANRIPDVDDPHSFYDYRGYWKDIASRGGDQRKAYDDGLHFPDTYKQHGHPTFSVESKYSRGPGDGGVWLGETFVPQDLVAYFRELAQKQPQQNPFQVAPADATGYAVPQTPTNVGGYHPGISEMLQKAIIPWEYPTGMVQDPTQLRMLASDAWYKLNHGRTLSDPASEDAWSLFLGLPQKNNTFTPSPFKPTNSTDKSAVYFRPPQSKPLPASIDEMVRIIRREAKAQGRTTERGAILKSFVGPMESAKYSLGSDEHGHYISVYDVYDFEPKALNYAGKPFEIYDRIYYDPKTFKRLPDPVLPRQK